TAGVPVNTCPECEEEEARFCTARTKPSAMSVAAPLAGVTVTMIPRASAATSATRSGERANQRAPRRRSARARTCRPTVPPCHEFCGLEQNPIPNCDGQCATLPDTQPGNLLKAHGAELGISCELRPAIIAAPDGRCSSACSWRRSTPFPGLDPG